MNITIDPLEITEDKIRPLLLFLDDIDVEYESNDLGIDFDLPISHLKQFTYLMTK
jgi:hypothetical protein